MNEGADVGADRTTNVPMIAATATNKPIATGLVALLWVVIRADAV